MRTEKMFHWIEEIADDGYFQRCYREYSNYLYGKIFVSFDEIPWC